MRIGLIIADFEMSFTTSFKHAARVKYNVEFTSSNVVHIRENLQQLKEQLNTGNHNKIHVGNDLTIHDVEHIESLLDAIMNAYAETFSINAPPTKKIYTLINQLRETKTQTPEQIAKEVLKDILTPSQPQKLTPKQRLQADANAKSMERAINFYKKNSAKKGS